MKLDITGQTLKIYTPEIIVTDNLVLNLDANNYSGSGDWLDQSGQGTNVSLSGPTYNSDDGGYFEFDGINDRGTFTTGSAFGFGTGQYTVELWVDTYHDGAWGFYFTNKTSAGVTTAMMGVAGSNEKFNFGNTSQIAAAPAFPINSWSGWKHIVVSREGTGTNQNNLYINSEFIGNVTDDYNYGSDGTSGYLGSWDETEYIKAKWSSFRVYKGKALTADEVKQNYYARIQRFDAGISSTRSIIIKPTFSLPDNEIIPLHIDPSNILSVNADNRINNMNMVANLAGVTTISGSVGVGSTFPCTGSSSAYKPDWDSNYGGSIEFKTTNSGTSNRNTWSKIGIGTPVIGYNTFDYGYSYAAEMWWYQNGNNRLSGENGRWWEAKYRNGFIFGPEDAYESGSFTIYGSYVEKYSLLIYMVPQQVTLAYNNFRYPRYAISSKAAYVNRASGTIEDRWILYNSSGYRLISDKWQHIVFVYDLANQLGGGIKSYGYVNGYLVTTNEPQNLIGNGQADQLPDTVSLVNTNYDRNNIVFGGNLYDNYGNVARYMSPFGNLGKFRLYNRALTGDEVLENFMQSKDRFEPDVGLLLDL